ncbi:MAG TPA: hypothetical protein VIL71_00780 [Spirillospora sp.]
MYRTPFSPEVAQILATLRASFPGWGVIADAAAGRWFAVKGRTVVSARDPLTLASRVTATGGVPLAA